MHTTETNIGTPQSASVRTVAHTNDAPSSGQLARVLDLFFSPTRLFRSIRFNKTWWLPFVLTIVCNLALTFSAAYRVGIPQLSMNVLRSDPASAERFDSMSPEQRAATLNATETTFRISAFATPVLILLFNVFYALVLWVGFSFVGGNAKFASLFTVLLYADLIQNVRSLLGTVTVFVTPFPNLFNLQTPLGSNIAYYLSSSAPGWLRVLGESADIITLWYLALITLGCAVVANLKRGTAASVVFGLWLLVVVTRVVWAVTV